MAATIPEHKTLDKYVAKMVGWRFMQSDVVRFTVRGQTIGEIRKKAQLEIWRFLADDPRRDAYIPLVSSSIAATHVDTISQGANDLTICYYDADIEVQL
jgi:hypothetical protein